MGVNIVSVVHIKFSSYYCKWIKRYSRRKFVIIFDCNIFILQYKKEKSQQIMINWFNFVQNACIQETSSVFSKSIIQWKNKTNWHLLSLKYINLFFTKTNIRKMFPSKYVFLNEGCLKVCLYLVKVELWYITNL